MNTIFQKRLFGLALLLSLSLCALSQTINPQVINSAGGDRPSGSGNLLLVDNVGEVFIQTVNGGTNSITQGFLQSFSVAPGYTADIGHSNVTCQGKKDGTAFVEILPEVPEGYTITCIWSDTTLCPQNDCLRLDSLGPGTFSVTVILTRTISPGVTASDTIEKNYSITVLDINPQCDIVVYTGVTANKDNVNDYFYIKNIEQYPDNRLTIYNRWGGKLYDVNKYDNVEVRWPEEEDLRTLTSGTYFYILELGNGTAPIKGWVELLKN